MSEIKRIPSMAEWIETQKSTPAQSTQPQQSAEKKVVDEEEVTPEGTMTKPADENSSTKVINDAEKSLTAILTALGTVGLTKSELSSAIEEAIKVIKEQYY
ncbi:MAG: hypothetical protein WC979_01595 [Candidatus Pacearchaeota archaeon]|jgi:hypothetical protein|nr:hypothetical protein [Clostridia bacterium]